MSLNDNDRAYQYLALYKKDGTLVKTGEDGNTTISLDGIPSGTVIATGDYQVAWTDGTHIGTKVDVPGVTVQGSTTTTTSTSTTSTSTTTTSTTVKPTTTTTSTTSTTTTTSTTQKQG